MAHAIRVPRLGWSMEEGILVRWLKQPGEQVAVGEPLYELEGEKALQEIGSLDAGILYLPADAPAPGTTVLVGALLGYLLAPGEAPPVAGAGNDDKHDNAAATAPTPKTEKPPKPNIMPAAGPAARRMARKLGKAAEAADSAAVKSVSSGRTVAVPATNGSSQAKKLQPAAHTTTAVASPRARRVAAELGVDWTTLAGTGRDGRIREMDVRDAAASGATPPAPQVQAGENVLTPRRKAIAQRLRQSRDATVPVTLTTTADVTNLVALRAQFKAAAAGVTPAYTDLVASLVARVLRRHPRLAVRWSNDQSQLFSVSEDELHVGIAVDTPDGLLVPVVRDILRKSLVAIAEESRELADKARAGRLTAGEMQAAVITVSNLGAYGIDAFTPVINFPEITILGLGAVRREPVVIEKDQIVIRERMVLSLTFDHAAVDGAPAAAFLADIAAALANPAAHLLGV
jgi:pyruvate dehydrogenase E2 component (dihydrolipoamide acetyltransferase)